MHAHRELVAEEILMATASAPTAPRRRFQRVRPSQTTTIYDYDPTRAATADEAGWAEGDDGVREKDGERSARAAVPARQSTSRW